jgi:hypothetical protein
MTFTVNATLINSLKRISLYDCRTLIVFCCDLLIFVQQVERVPAPRHCVPCTRFHGVCSEDWETVPEGYIGSFTTGFTERDPDSFVLFCWVAIAMGNWKSDNSATPFHVDRFVFHSTRKKKKKKKKKKKYIYIYFRLVFRCEQEMESFLRIIHLYGVLLPSINQSLGNKILIQNMTVIYGIL